MDKSKDFIILKPEELDFSKISFSSVRTNGFGGKSVYMYYDKKRLYLRLPKMRSPFGAGAYQESDKYNIDLSLDEDNPDVKVLKKKLIEMDKKIMSFAVDKSVEWFGKEKTHELVEDKYTSQLRESKKDTYAPCFRIKLTKNKKDEFIVELYDSEKNELNIDDKNVTDVLHKGVKVKSIVECVGLWFMGTGKFGVSWRAQQMKTFPSHKKLEGYAFVEDSDVEEESEEDDALAPEKE